MEPKQKFAAVGFFLITTSLTLVGLSVWLQGSLAHRDKACYIMQFDNSVAGLSQGSPITFRGVGVGQVQTIRINPVNDAQILVQAALDKQTPIKPNTIASLKPQGITGSSYIELNVKEGETRSGQLTHEEGSCRLIVTVPSDIEQIVNRLPQILDNALLVTQRLSTLLDKDNAENVRATLANFNALSSELSKTSGALSPQLQQATTQLQAAMTSLNRLSSQLENKGNTAESLQSTMRQTQDTLGEVKSLAETLRTNMRRTLLAPTVHEVKVP